MMAKQSRNGKRYKMKKATIMLTLLCTAVFAQQKGTFKDPYDSKTYKTVKIGTQTWMAENLNYAAKGSKCYDNKPANCQKYGRLYDWETAKKACPKGWLLPSNADWDKLLRFADGTSGTKSPYSSKTAGYFLKATSGWNNNGNGEDKYGFSALPGGSGYSGGSFSNVGSSGRWWSKDYDYDSDGSCGWSWSMAYSDESAGAGLSSCGYGMLDGLLNESARLSIPGTGLSSVRCLQNPETETNVENAIKTVKAPANSFTDPRDKKTYKTVKIGAQTWMGENLDYAGKNDNIGVCHGKKPANCKKYGALYTYGEAMKVCPLGWHLPGKDEWQALVDLAGGEKIAGKKLKTGYGWEQHECKYATEETSGRGKVTVTEYDNCSTDEFGFSALPGGGGRSGIIDDGDGYDFDGIGYFGNWWIASGSNANYAYIQNMNHDNGHAYTLTEEVTHSDEEGDVSLLYSVRCASDSEIETNEVSASSFTDPSNGKAYKTVKIGTQTWMAENLKSSKCYENKPENCQKYGGLYDWETAKKACPKGWHLPSQEEWDKLTRYVNPQNETAGKLLKAKSGWNDYEGKSGNGTDNYGFAALPGGGNSVGSFENIGNFGYWWSATENNASNAYVRIIRYYRDGAYWDENNKSYLFSVRCIQDYPAKKWGIF
jgi:uncharacterized protein (TIGR02145 family)